MRAFLLILALTSAPLPAAADCLAFAPRAHLSGVLVRETFPGPPNFESIAAGDQAQTYFLLRLPSPICVEGDPEISPGSKQVDEIQLVFEDPGMFARYRPLLGKSVVVDGAWLSAISASHRTPMLLTHVSIDRAG